jgi:RNA polymerase sigma factor (sigma-70 family)
MAMHAPVALVLNRLLGANEQSPVGASAVETAIATAWLADGDAQALFGFVRRLGLSDEQADDAVQEVFTRLLAEHRSGIVIANPRAWAYRSIYRLAMDQHRIRTRLGVVVGALGLRSQRRPVDDTDRIAVWAEVDRLPLRQRQVIYLRYRSDLDYEEIGQALGITASAARSHATQAMATLRTRLAAARDEVPHGH